MLQPAAADDRMVVTLVTRALAVLDHDPNGARLCLDRLASLFADRRAEPALTQLIARFPEEVMLVWKHYPLSIHAGARPAAEAAQCPLQDVERLVGGMVDMARCRESRRMGELHGGDRAAGPRADPLEGGQAANEPTGLGLVIGEGIVVRHVSHAAAPPDSADRDTPPHPRLRVWHFMGPSPIISLSIISLDTSAVKGSSGEVVVLKELLGVGDEEFAALHDAGVI